MDILDTVITDLSKFVIVNIESNEENEWGSVKTKIGKVEVNGNYKFDGDIGWVSIKTDGPFK